MHSGAYTVQTNAGGGYRSDAAAAKLARAIASDYYGQAGHIYGHVYGGSGGSYETVGAMENTQGVWDGAVPYVIGGPTSIPTNFFVRALARLVLADKATALADAMRPGGSGVPEQGLDAVERAVFDEVSAMGVPVRGWDDYSYLLGLHDGEGLMGFRDTVKSMDSTYAEDFWSRPGYLGTEQSPLGDIVRRARVRETGTIGAIAHDAGGKLSGFTIDHRALPAYAFGLDVTVLGGDGRPVGKVAGSWSDRSAATARAFTVAAGNPAPVLAALRSGATVRIDNDWTLASTTYHRHQVRRGDGFTAWDQFVAADGQPPVQRRAANAQQLHDRFDIERALRRGQMAFEEALHRRLHAQSFPRRFDPQLVIGRNAPDSARRAVQQVGGRGNAAQLGDEQLHRQVRRLHLPLRTLRVVAETQLLVAKIMEAIEHADDRQHMTVVRITLQRARLQHLGAQAGGRLDLFARPAVHFFEHIVILADHENRILPHHLPSAVMIFLGIRITEPAMLATAQRRMHAIRA